MNFYLDTSAFAKLYILEGGSDDVLGWVVEARAIWTSVVTFPEARSAFGRRLRERTLSALDHHEILRQLDHDWSHLTTIHVDPVLARAAGVLCTHHGLRGFDSIQLASALEACNQLDGQIQAATHDPVLARAMRAEGLRVLGK